MRKPRQNPLDKARAKPGSIRLAVNAKCYDCQGRDADPGVTERIRTCEIPECSLFPVRPYRIKSRGTSVERSPVAINRINLSDPLPHSAQTKKAA